MCWRWVDTGGHLLWLNNTPHSAGIDTCYDGRLTCDTLTPSLFEFWYAILSLSLAKSILRTGVPILADSCRTRHWYWLWKSAATAALHISTSVQVMHCRSSAVNRQTQEDITDDEVGRERASNRNYKIVYRVDSMRRTIFRTRLAHCMDTLWY